MSHDNVFLKVLLFIEMFNSRLLKKQTLDEKTEEVMRLVLQDLQTGLQAPTATFENILICLSFCTRFHVRTLKKGQEEGLALQVTRSLLAKIVQLNSNSPRTTNQYTACKSHFLSYFCSALESGARRFKSVLMNQQTTTMQQAVRLTTFQSFSNPQRFRKHPLFTADWRT